MKKIISLLCATLLISAVALAGSTEPEKKTKATEEVNNADPNGLAGRAIGAVKSSCPFAEGKLSAIVQFLGLCLDGTEVYRVVVYSGPNCPPGQICPLGPIVLIGTVDFGCDGEMTVECGVQTQ